MTDNVSIGFGDFRQKQRISPAKSLHNKRLGVISMRSILKSQHCNSVDWLNIPFTLITNLNVQFLISLRVNKAAEHFQNCCDLPHFFTSV